MNDISLSSLEHCRHCTAYKEPGFVHPIASVWECTHCGSWYSEKRERTVRRRK